MQNTLIEEHTKSIQAINDRHDAALQEANSAYTNAIEKLKLSEADTKELEVELKTSKERYDTSLTEIKDTHFSETQSLLKEIDDLKQAANLFESKYTEQNKQIVNLKMEIEEYESNDINNHAVLLSRSNRKDDDKFQEIVKQHQKELNVLQQQFQNLLDMKDLELEELSYRLKTMTGNELKEAEKIQQELKARIVQLEEEANSKELEMRWLESDSEQNETKLKQQDMIVHNLEDNNNRLERKVMRFKEENDQMLRLIHQLQSEMHPMNK
ncbi:hypothetical protein K501DRAFT_216795 [Backusella circina FSU 941]|nr:hypothetical protein K501DRAFT_234675 [Backusella circina FSU 941]KAI8884797.1 hypothetical protein K501DRAFT_216795 [Backusella circina FSU 941]